MTNQVKAYSIAKYYAWKFNNLTKIDKSLEIEDLISEGIQIYLELLQKKGDEAIYLLGRTLSNHFKDKYRKYSKRVSESLSDNVPNPDSRVFLFLEKDAKEVAIALTEAPQDLIELVKDNKFRVGLGKYLNSKGWKWDSIKEFYRRYHVS